MALIDKDGKLFGKINLIDALVVLIIILVAVAAGYVLFSSPKSTPTTSSGEKEYVNVVLKSEQPNTMDISIKKGDHLRTYGGRYDWGEIVDVKTQPQTMVMPNSSGTAVETQNPMSTLLIVTVKVPGVYQNEQGFFNGETHIQNGATFEFETPTFAFTARVYEMEKTGE